MQGQEFVVAGGSKGIGLELVKQLVAAGARVTVLSRTAEELQGMQNVAHLAWDATADELAASQLPDEIHGVVYCPGSLNLRSVKQLKLDMFRDDFELNVIGAIRVIQAALGGLKKGRGSIVLFSTVAVGQGMHAHASIATAKGAIEGLMRSLAAELAPAVRANCIAPALTETALTQRLFKDPERAEKLGEMYPLARTGKPQDIAAMAKMLLSEEGSWITGQVIGVDGGMSSVRKQ